jgi:uncharacterized protein (DUF1810 family)
LFGVPRDTRLPDVQTDMTKRIRPTPGDPDPYDLRRFIDAQEGVYESALSEIRSGRKRSHWMWYIFPQCEGLGSSPTSRRYAIRSLDEAKAYLRHPVLGPRLLESANVALRAQGCSASDVFGYPDDMKLRSCATLFACASPAGSPFEQLLDKYFGGERDEVTMGLLGFKSDAASIHKPDR